ncbi:MAG: hypothetical protein N3E47_04685 [Candidatus Bathyarchaeota archaeon]|nr:hypothetical protein [Candidatus Bathyarchaeota archaeon]
MSVAHLGSMGLPSRFHKTVKVPADQLLEALSQILHEGSVEENIGGKTFKSTVGWKAGVTLKVRVIPEGDVSSLEFDFSYRGLMLTILIVLVAFIALSLILSSLIPILLSLAAILLLVYIASLELNEFLRKISDTLSGLEAEYHRMKLMKDRARWRSDGRNIEDLYRRLCEKHVKMWGSTFTLEYKIREYERQGLTRDEAIRKISEEEGIF